MVQKAEKSADVSIKFTCVLIVASLILAAFGNFLIQSPPLAAIGLTLAAYGLIMLVATIFLRALR